MNRLLLAGLLAASLAATVTTGSAQAQAGTGQYYVPVPQYGVGQRQLLSPYLNLVSPNLGIGTTTGINTLSPLNYYNLTLPEQQRRANLQSVNNQLSQIELGQAPGAGIGQDEIAELTMPLSATGHMSFYNVTGGYFNNNRVGISVINRLGGGQRPGGAQGQQQQQGFRGY